MIYPKNTVVVLKGPTYGRIDPALIGNSFTIADHIEKRHGRRCGHCGSTTSHILEPMLYSLKGQAVSACGCLLIKITPDNNRFELEEWVRRPRPLKHCIKA